MLIKSDTLAHQDRYKLLSGSILPRPIAWVSSMDADGNLNLAPFSFFAPVCNDPMTLLFCPSVQESGSPKDTLRNIQAVPEFVVNLTNEETAQAMNLSATSLPPDQSEFELAGLTPAPSSTISVPRVAEAPIAFECRLQQIVTVNDQPGGGSIVIGTVECIYIRDDLYANGRVDLEAFAPIGRLAGSAYTRVTDIFEMERGQK